MSHNPSRMRPERAKWRRTSSPRKGSSVHGPDLPSAAEASDNLLFKNKTRVEGHAVARKCRFSKPERAGDLSRWFRLLRRFARRARGPTATIVVVLLTTTQALSAMATAITTPAPKYL